MNQCKRIQWNDILVANNDPIDGEEIVKTIYDQTGIGVTRQNISNALKNAMGNFFYKLIDIHQELTPFLAAVEMLKMLYIPHSNFRGGVNSFFRLFPTIIRKLIENDAKLKYIRGQNMDIEKEDLLTLLCKNCYECKISKDRGVYCDKGYFKNKKIGDIELYMPYDFDCLSFNEMY